MKQPFIVGVMGGGSASEEDMAAARLLGKHVAQQGWILLNGGRNSGIMEASAKGAAEAGGLTLGILPDADLGRCSRHIRIPVLTGMGSARNYINILTSHVVVACSGGAGTISEIALALKHGRSVILLNFDTGNLFTDYAARGRLFSAATVDEVIDCILKLQAEQL